MFPVVLDRFRIDFLIVWFDQANFPSFWDGLWRPLGGEFGMWKWRVLKSWISKIDDPAFFIQPFGFIMSKRSKKWQLCFVYQYKIIVRLLRDTFHYFLSCNNATSICYKITFLRECYRCSIILVVFQWYQAVLCHQKITGYILK